MYSPEPWKCDGSRVIGADGIEILDPTRIDDDDAARIVATVNACAGIQTEELARIGPAAVINFWLRGGYKTGVPGVNEIRGAREQIVRQEISDDALRQFHQDGPDTLSGVWLDEDCIPVKNTESKADVAKRFNLDPKDLEGQQ